MQLFNISCGSWFAVAVFHFRAVYAFEQCYYPDGSVPTDYIWEPCTGSQYSSCCIPSEGDICQENGLCYFPNYQMVYRGTCTDRTWNDPACPSNICLIGFESTWVWITECDVSGSSSYACGPVSDGMHSDPTCAANAVSNTALFQTTTSTTSYGRYTPLPSLDPSIYSVYISTYTTALTANAQTTTLTSTFQSTFTSTIGDAAAVTSGTTSSATGISSPIRSSGHIILPTGVLVGIIVGAVVFAISISVGIFFLLRRRSTKREQEVIRLDSPAYPPPNGPVGADQISPYEVDINEVPRLPQKYNYTSPKIGTHEMDGPAAMLRGEKNGVHQMMTEDHDEVRSPLRSPAPAYVETLLPFELDGTSSLKNGRGLGKSRMD